jgi:sialate O-acetylesterase
MKTQDVRLTIVVFLFTALTAVADVSLPAIFTDGMVLQQRSTITVWGWANPGEKVTVKGSWQWLGKAKATADADGQWRIRLKTPKAGGPYTLSVQGTNAIVLSDVLIGEVWICSGQSNMQWTLDANKTDEFTKNAIETANYPNIRQFAVSRAFGAAPLSDCKGQWLVCTPQTAEQFSAVAFYFGRELNKKLNVPIGLISTSWGGTVAEAWTSAESLRAYGDFNDVLNTLQAPKEQPEAKLDQNTPTALYNAMIHPLVGFRIAGAIWYQGESNAGRAMQYRTLFPAMIKDWRTQWRQGDFPFYYVQIAPYKYADSNAPYSAFLREAQMFTLKALPNVGMAVTMDIGEEQDIHPKNKADVGDRLARWALAKNYGHKDLAYSGPIYKGMTVEDSAIRLSFDYAGSGLVARGGPLTSFEIAGSDQKFVPAKAEIDGASVVVSSAEVPNPAAVRYAFKNWAQPNLFNTEGLPASSFRTDDWPIQ